MKIPITKSNYSVYNEHFLKRKEKKMHEIRFNEFVYYSGNSCTSVLKKAFTVLSNTFPLSWHEIQFSRSWSRAYLHSVALIHSTLLMMHTQKKRKTCQVTYWHFNINMLPMLSVGPYLFSTLKNSFLFSLCLWHRL